MNNEDNRRRGNERGMSVWMSLAGESSCVRPPRRLNPSGRSSARSVDFAFDLQVDIFFVATLTEAEILLCARERVAYEAARLALVALLIREGYERVAGDIFVRSRIDDD